MRISIGLYRHFKGEYYYVSGLSKSAKNEIMVNYFNVCHPEYGSFVRAMDEFNDEVITRADNVTGQMYRMERVLDINFQIESVSTEQLIRELEKRVDSPIHELDIEGLNSPVCFRDYVVGEFYEETKECPAGVYSLSFHDTQEKAENKLRTTPHKKCAGVFKRTFIRMN